MYIPHFNRVENPAITLDFIKAHPFAIIVSTDDHGPVATPVPLLVNEGEHGLSLTGHFAKSNEHWSALERDQESLIIFHGPHAYISPRLYEIYESVPTWNYAMVQIYGKGRVLRDNADALQVLTRLISHFDPAFYARWVAFSQEYRDRMLRGIVAFEIKATRVETKFKLGQNRTATEQATLIQALENSCDSAARDLASLMRRQELSGS